MARWLSLALWFAVAANAAAVSELRIGGSGTNLGAIKLVAKQFSARYPDVNISIPPSLGSGGAIRALSQGWLDIGFTSRPLNTKEQGLAIQATRYAKTPLVFAVKQDCPATNMTIPDLIAIYLGQKLHWKTGAAIRPILRPQSDSDILVLIRRFPELKKPLAKAYHRRGIHIGVTDQEAAKYILSTPGGFGTSTLALILSERHPLKTLSLNGVAPTVKSISNGQYPLYKELYFVLPETPSTQARAFIRFLISSKGQRIMEQTGHQLMRADINGYIDAN